MTFVRFRVAVFAAWLIASLGVGCGSSDPPADEVAQTAPAAVPPAVTNARPNAATEYARIRDRMGQGFFDPMINFDPKNAPNQAESAFLASQQDLVRDIIAASKMERCDFNTDFSQGMDILMPHLGTMRHCCVLLRDDSVRFIQQPSGQAGAAERMAAIVRIGKQAGSEPVVVSKLVGISCVGVCTNFVAQWKDRLTDPLRRADIRIELETVRDSNLYYVRPALRQELALAKITLNKSDIVDIEGQKIQISSQERAAIIADLERVFAEMDNAWGAPDAEQQFKRIIDSIRIPKARMVVAAFNVFVRQMHKSQSDVNVAIATLKR
jgi:hypothetical protein